jgi:hypothetical protein
MSTIVALARVEDSGMKKNYVKTTKFAVVTFANPRPAKAMMIARSLFAVKTLIFAVQ